MTLERHRSSLIPDVDFGGDGRIFVTDRQGSYALRSKHYDKPNSKDIDWNKKGDNKKNKDRHKVSRADSWDRPWEYDKGNRYLGDTGSFHSYDPKREQRKYKPKSMTSHELAMREVTGTVSSKSSNSLSRKLRRSKSNKYYMDDERYADFRSVSTVSASRRFKRGGTPVRPFDVEEFKRSNSRYRSLDVNALRRVQNEMNNNGVKSPYGKADLNGYAGTGSGSVFDGYIPRVKKISDEKLPFVFFLILGVLIFLLGLTKVLFTYWHQYFCLLWTGIAVTGIGLAGLFHKGEYLDTIKNVCYILLAALGAICTMVSVAFTLPVLVPTLRLVVDGTNTTEIPSMVAFTNWNRTLVPISSLTGDVMAYLSICLDVAGLMLVCAGFSSLTVMLIALTYYWDASFDTTGECDHRGKPRFFNPLEQMSLAQATIFLGLLSLNLQLPEVNTYFSPIWGPFLLLIAGFSAVCFGKRPDLSGLGFLSTLIQGIAMLASGFATVMTTLALVECISALTSADNGTVYRQSELIASAVFGGIFILVMIVNIVFAVGVIFRHIRHMCCQECFEDYLSDPFNKKFPEGDPYDVRL